MNWLLIVVLIILAASALRGYQNGFIKTIFSLFSVIVALVVSGWISPMISKSLQQNEKIMSTVTTKLEEVIKFDGGIKKTNEEVSFINKLSLPNSMKDYLIENNHKEIYEAMNIEKFDEYVTHLLATVILNAVSYLLCFVVVLVCLAIISRLVDFVSRLPLLNELNKTGGFAIGLLHGVIKVWIFFLLITIFSTTSFGENIFPMINQSVFLTFLYENNLLLKLITNVATFIF